MTKRVSINLVEAIETINKEVKGLTQYGMRKVRVTRPSYRLAWSNNQSEWQMRYGRTLPTHGEVFVDANELLIAGFNKMTVKRALPYLLPLPLYTNSTEYKQQEEWSLQYMKDHFEECGACPRCEAYEEEQAIREIHLSGGVVLDIQREKEE